VRRAGFLLGVGAVSYVAVAWQVAPGFYDCCAPPVVYNWVSPPPFVTGNQPPKSGHRDIKVIGGVSDADSAATDDGQLVMSFLPGVFDGAGRTSISVDIHPVANYPAPGGFKFVTNVYLVSASAPLVKAANVDMIFSNVLPAPSNIYNAPADGGVWKSIGPNPQAQPYTINSETSQFGYFAVGFPASAVSGGGFESQVLPIVAALLIVGVLIAGVPLAIVRRRNRDGEAE